VKTVTDVPLGNPPLVGLGSDGDSVYRAFFEEFDKSVADGTSKDCFATKFNAIVGKYDFVSSPYETDLTSRTKTNKSL
jgi:hypothetical protein